MEKAYRIFTGAPCIKGFPDSDQPTWQTLTTRENTSVIPSASLQQVDSRLSLIYQNVIFNSEDESEEIRNFLEDGAFPCSSTAFCGLIFASDPSNSSFLEGPSSIGPSLAKNHGSSKSQECTFDADMSGENSTFLSEGSSIRRFPTFAFNPNSISSLSLLSGMLEQSYESARIALLLGILEVDGPSYVKSKAPPHTEMALLKIVAGSEDGSLCKIVAWRETAEIWSGDYQDRALKRGDIVLFESANYP